MTTTAQAISSRSRAVDVALAAAREIGVAVMAGTLAGIVVGGLGGRLVMRVSGALTDPALVGLARTANGNLVGDVTLDGTMGLVLFTGVLGGTFAGVLYAAVRPWLTPLGRWAGIAFGLYLLGLMGAFVFEQSNFDFRRFGPPLLNVAMFAALFPLFGIPIGPIAGAIDGALGARPGAVRWAAVLAVALGVLMGAGILFLAVGSTVASFTGQAQEGSPEGRLAAAMALVAIVVGFAGRRWLRGRPGYVLLALPLAVGSYLTLTGIAGILVR